MNGRFDKLRSENMVKNYWNLRRRKTGNKQQKATQSVGTNPIKRNKSSHDDTMEGVLPISQLPNTSGLTPTSSRPTSTPEISQREVAQKEADYKPKDTFKHKNEKDIFTSKSINTSGFVSPISGLPSAFHPISQKEVGYKPKDDFKDVPPSLFENEENIPPPPSNADSMEILCWVAEVKYKREFLISIGAK